MNRKRNRNGFRSGERGEESLKYLKRRYENRYLSEIKIENLIKKNIPESLEGLADILVRAVTKRTREDQLPLTCRMIARLVEHKIKCCGFDCEGIRIRRNFDSGRENVFEIEKYNITYPEQEAENRKRELEKDIFSLYRLKIKFSSPTKR